MTELLLVRTAGGPSCPDGTFGTLTGAGLHLLSAEDDWRNNAPGISCIPAATYRIIPTIYHKHNYPVWWVTDVPGRERILIGHYGNTEENVEGCILLGTASGTFPVQDEDDPAHPLVYKRGVANSRGAHDLFMAALEGLTEATLTITWAPGLPR